MSVENRTVDNYIRACGGTIMLSFIGITLILSSVWDGNPYLAFVCVFIGWKFIVYDRKHNFPP